MLHNFQKIIKKILCITKFVLVKTTRSYVSEEKLRRFSWDVNKAQPIRTWPRHILLYLIGNSIINPATQANRPSAEIYENISRIAVPAFDTGD